MITTIPTRTIADPASATDINTLMANDSALYASLGALPAGVSYPVPGVQTASTSVMVGYLTILYNMTLTKIRITLKTANTGDTFIVDVHYHATTLSSAVSIFSTQSNRPTIADGGYSADSGTPDTTSVVKNGYLVFFVDKVGSTVAGSDLVINVEGNRA